MPCVVGAGTVRADDPLLTTRALPRPLAGAGRHRHRAPARAARTGCFGGGPPTLLLCAEDAPAGDAPATPNCCACRARGAGPRHRRHRRRPAARGLRRVFVEGGGITVSRFLAAGCLDRLHVTIAPLLLGAGIPAFTLPGVACPQDGMRLDWTVHRLGDDLLLDIPLRRRRDDARARSGPWRPGAAKSAPRRCRRRRPARVGVRTLASGISRGTEALVFAGRVPPSQYAAMRAPLMGGAFPVPGEIRLQRRRRSTETGARVFVLHPHQDRFRRPGGDVHPRARCGADAARRARRQHGDRAEHRLGRGAAGRRAHAGDRRRRGRAARRLRCSRASPAAAVTVVDIDAARARARRAARLPLRAAGRRARPSRISIVHASGTRGRAAPGARPRRLRGAHRRGELVRRPRARAAAGRGVPCAPAAADRRARSAASRRRCAAAAAMPSGWRWRSPC